MKKVLYTICIVMLAAVSSKAQTTAMDFTKIDCNGVSHHLFSELDSGYVIIMEFIMTCNSCIVGGHALESMMADLDTHYPGKIRFYQIAYTNSYTCATMIGFKNTNGFASTVFDQGASLVAYYGGFGMPTVAIAAGSNHDVLYSSMGFASGDTAQAGTAIRSFFSTLSINTLPNTVSSFTAFPNPAKDEVSLDMNLKTNATVTIQLVDLSGRMVKQFFTESFNSGSNHRTIDVTTVATGNYMLKAIVDGKEMINKINISR